MSLKLRKACQSVLDKGSLANYHIRVNENNRAMTLVGECGKPLVAIYGIKFSSISPSNAEIEYAAELLDAFLTKHLHTIQKAIKAKQAANELKAPAKPDNVTINRYGSISFTGKHNDIKYGATLSRNGRGQMVVNLTDDLPIEFYDGFTVPKDMIDFADAYHHYSKEVETLRDTAQEAAQALNACDI